MERWEKLGDAAEFWELELAGTVLTEKVGHGGATVVRAQHCDTEAMARGIRERMVAQRVRQGFTQVGAAPAATPAPQRPTFPGLADGKLTALLARVAKIVHGGASKYGEAIEKATGDRKQRVAVAWFLVEHRLVEAERLPGFWGLLAQQPELPTPEVVFAFLARLPFDAEYRKLFKHEPLAWFVEGFDDALDTILFFAYRRGQAHFDAHRAELPAPVQLALDFVRGRMGLPVPADRGALLLSQFARGQTRHGLASNRELLELKDGEVIKPRLANAAAVRALALRFGSEAQWGQAMVKAALAVKEASSASVHDALVACTADELAFLLARPFSFGSNDNLAAELRVVEQERADPPEALVHAAQTLADRTDHGKEVRELLAVVAARRFGEAGREVPVELDALLKFEFLSGVYFESIRPYVAGLAAMPRARVHALVERQLAQPHFFGRGLGALLAHPDEGLLGRFFDKDTGSSLEPAIVGRFGSAALPHLARAWEKTPSSSRRTRHQQILTALAFAAEQGDAIAPEWDSFIGFDAEGDEVLKYWDPSYAALRGRALKGLPPERRAALLLQRTREARYPERPLAAAVVLDDDAALAAVVETFVERRAGADKHQVLAAFRALGARAEPALQGCAERFRDDEAFRALVAEAGLEL